jgi:hypothetical protein
MLLLLHRSLFGHGLETPACKIAARYWFLHLLPNKLRMLFDAWLLVILLMTHLKAVDFLLKVVQLLLQSRVLGSHLLVLLFPLVALVLEGLHLALEMASLDIGLSKPKQM